MVFSFHASSSSWITANKWQALDSAAPYISALQRFVSKICTHAQRHQASVKKWLDKAKFLGLLFSLHNRRSFKMMENRCNGLSQDNHISHWCLEVPLKQADPFSGQARFCKPNYVSHECEQTKTSSLWETATPTKSCCGCSATKEERSFSSWYSWFCLGSSDKLHPQKKHLGSKKCFSSVGCQPSDICMSAHSSCRRGESQCWALWSPHLGQRKAKRRIRLKGSDSLISKRTLRHCSAGKAAAMLCAGTSGSTFLPDTCPRLQSRYLSETIPSQRLLHDKVQSFLGCWCEPVPVHKANCCFMVGLRVKPGGSVLHSAGVQAVPCSA